MSRVNLIVSWAPNCLIFQNIPGRFYFREMLTYGGANLVIYPNKYSKIYYTLTKYAKFKRPRIN